MAPEPALVIGHFSVGHFVGSILYIVKRIKFIAGFK